MEEERGKSLRSPAMASAQVALYLGKCDTFERKIADGYWGLVNASTDAFKK